MTQILDIYPVTRHLVIINLKTFLSFEDSGKKMVFTESGNGVSMTTTFEAC